MKTVVNCFSEGSTAAAHRRCFCLLLNAYFFFFYFYFLIEKQQFYIVGPRRNCSRDVRCGPIELNVVCQTLGIREEKRLSAANNLLYIKGLKITKADQKRKSLSASP